MFIGASALQLGALDARFNRQNEQQSSGRSGSESGTGPRGCLSGLAVAMLAALGAAIFVIPIYEPALYASI